MGQHRQGEQLPMVKFREMIRLHELGYKQSEIARNCVVARSHLMMIWLLEDLLRKIPRGLHAWHQFLTPSELTHMLAQSGFEAVHIAGFNRFGSTLAEYWITYWHYQTTG